LRCWQRPSILFITQRQHGQARTYRVIITHGKLIFDMPNPRQRSSILHSAQLAAFVGAGLPALNFGFLTTPVNPVHHPKTTEAHPLIASRHL